MAHPDDHRIVPACVQHSLLDPQENARLLQVLPPDPTGGAGAGPAGDGA
jgi:hypothetical protein